MATRTWNRMAAVAVAITAVAAGSLASSPARAAALVPVVVSLTDTNGRGIAGLEFYAGSSDGTSSLTKWATTDARGRATVSAIPNSTVQVVPNDSITATNSDGSALRWLPGSALADGPGSAMAFTANTGPSGTTVNRKARILRAAPKAGVGFARVQYDAAGPDTTSRASLNGEFFQIRNYASSPRSLSGYSVRNAAGDIYTFAPVTLAPGAQLTVHTGSGTATAGHRYWNLGRHAWSNVRDTASLFSPKRLVARCQWSQSAPGHKVC